ncbi:hypothetical protein L1887_61120 [Cichorium endivia]|nr:hypothetical protein L1887_61120 [Cichorium endivia]
MSVQLRCPAIVHVLAQPEPIVLQLFVWQWIILAEDRLRNGQIIAGQNDVFVCGTWLVLADLQIEREQLVVGESLIAQLVFALIERIVIRVRRVVRIVTVADVRSSGRSPVLGILNEERLDCGRRIGWRRRAAGRMAVAEARQTALLVLQLQIEVAELAGLTLKSVHILFARTLSSHRIARFGVVQRTSLVAVARTTALRRKVVVVRQADITLVAAHTRLTQAGAVVVALQIDRSDRVAIARHTPAVHRLVVVLLAHLTVRSGRIVDTVHTSTAVPGSIVQFLIEHTLDRSTIAEAGFALKVK